MGFIRVASLKELDFHKMIAVKADGKEILILDSGSKYYAIGNRCTHMGCLLSDGVLNGDNIQCISHGSVFDVKTGEVIKGPAKKPVPTFEVKVDWDQILVSV